MGISENGGEGGGIGVPQNSIIPIIGTPTRVPPPVFENPHVGVEFRGPRRVMRLLPLGTHEAPCLLQSAALRARV